MHVKLHPFTVKIPVITNGHRKTQLAWSWDLGRKVVLETATKIGFQDFIANVQFGGESFVEMDVPENMSCEKIADFAKQLKINVKAALDEAYGEQADSMPNTPVRT